VDSVRVRDLHRRATLGFGRRVAAVGAEDWERSTPCDGWGVWALVNHVVVENLWVPAVLAGRTMTEVGDRFDGDQLGPTPHAAWAQAAAGALAAMEEPGALEREVHLSSGVVPAIDYARQLAVDKTLHTWDLAVALDGDVRLDPELVAAAEAWSDERQGTDRAAGSIRSPVEVGDDPDAQARLLARFGRPGASPHRVRTH